MTVDATRLRAALADRSPIERELGTGGKASGLLAIVLVAIAPALSDCAA
jgi:hypothetical protein